MGDLDGSFAVRGHGAVKVRSAKHDDASRHRRDHLVLVLPEHAKIVCQGRRKTVQGFVEPVAQAAGPRRLLALVLVSRFDPAALALYFLDALGQLRGFDWRPLLRRFERRLRPRRLERRLRPQKFGLRLPLRGFRLHPRGFGGHPRGFNRHPRGFNGCPRGFGGHPRGRSRHPWGFGGRLLREVRLLPARLLRAPTRLRPLPAVPALRAAAGASKVRAAGAASGLRAAAGASAVRAAPAASQAAAGAARGNLER